jgi:hypothetical protein
MCRKRSPFAEAMIERFIGVTYRRTIVRGARCSGTRRAMKGGINIAHQGRPATALARGAATQTDRTAFKQTQ